MFPLFGNVTKIFPPGFYPLFRTDFADADRLTTGYTLS
jgi:hypothetical protein